MRPCVTVAKCPIPPLTLCPCITPKDNRVTTLCTPLTTPSVTVVRNSCVHVRNCLHMLTVRNQRGKCYTFEKNRGTCKKMDASPLCHKVPYEPQMADEGQGHFTQCL